MMENAISTRRDTRYQLRAGTSSIEFPGHLSKTLGSSAVLTRISVSGLGFETDASTALETGALLEGVTIRVGDCMLKGDLVVRSIEPAGDPAVEVGCLFYPTGRGDGDRLMALIAGIEAVKTEI